MKRLIVLLVLVPFYSFGSIGENFERAGIQLEGYGHFIISDFAISSLDVAFGGEAGFLLINRFEPYVNFGYFFNNYYRTYQGLNLDIGAQYFFIPSPNANLGFVHSVGLSLSNLLIFDHDASYGLLIIPKYRLMYFITDRIAPGISIASRFNIVSWAQGANGIRIAFNFSYFLKSKEKVLVPVK